MVQRRKPLETCEMGWGRSGSGQVVTLFIAEAEGTAAHFALQSDRHCGQLMRALQERHDERVESELKAAWRGAE